VLENILARQKGFNELAFSGTILNFRRIRFGSSTKKIKENPDEIYRMVRGSLRGLMYVSDKNNKDTWLDMIAKHWSVKMRMSPVAATRFGVNAVRSRCKGAPSLGLRD
jgi:hypothetical protein